MTELSEIVSTRNHGFFGSGRMPTIQIEAELGQADLLRAVEQLNPAEFDRFVSQVLTLRARREAHSVSSSETELLLRINQGLPEELTRIIQTAPTAGPRSTYKVL